MHAPTPLTHRAADALLRDSLVLTALIASWLVAAPRAEAKELAGTRPNIILVMTDDQGKGQIGALGSDFLRTPHLDRLYAGSTRFTDFHVSPTCSPTRSAIMTGRHEFKNGVTHTILERERMTLAATTLAESLRDAGYATGIFGKWHLGDEEPYQPHRRGFTEAFIHGAGGIGQAYDCSCADAPPNRGEGQYFDNVIRHNGSFVQTRGFCTDVFFQAALGWIQERKETPQPFFVYLTPNAPHGPMIAPEASKRRFLEEGYDEETAGCLGMIENIDDNMGRLMDKLQAWDLEENTLLIFMTDNGQAKRSGKRNGKSVDLEGFGFKTGKGSPFEGGTSVPAFWRWKGMLGEGVDIKALAAHLDLFPTFAELAKAEVPEDQVEGRSLVPLLENPQAAWPDRLLFVHQGRWTREAGPESGKYRNFAVRSSRFRWVNGEELYDIAADPFEQVNVADRHPEVVEELRQAYEAWWASVRPLMVNEAVPLSATRPYFELYEAQQAAGGIPEWEVPTL